MSAPIYYADAQAIAVHYKVAVGTVHYWVSLYKIPRLTNPTDARRKLYSLQAFDEAAKSQQQKRDKRYGKRTPNG